MKKIILHIGRHKSGTTSIQKFLRLNRELLQENGYCYPETGIRAYAHHEFAERFTRQTLRSASAQHLEQNKIVLAALHAEIDACSLIPVISSEAFQNCDPETVHSLFNEYEVEIVVYLREQVGYLSSAYAQKVHATNYSVSLDEYYSKSFHADYFKFLSEWEQFFGDALTVRIFDRSSLINNDVVYDFVEGVLGLNDDLVKQHYVNDDANPTLTSCLLAYKLYVNREKRLSAEGVRMMYRGLATLAAEDQSPKVCATEEVALNAVEKYRESNRKTAKKYFSREILFQEKPYSYGRPYNISSREISEISEKLILIYPKLSQMLV